MVLTSSPETPLTRREFPFKISQLLIVDALVAHTTAADPLRIDTINRTASSVSDRNF